MGCGQSTNPPADLSKNKTVSVVPDDQAQPVQEDEPFQRRKLSGENIAADLGEPSPTKDSETVTKLSNGNGAEQPDAAPGERPPGRTIDLSKDTRALPEHLFLVFQKWPVLRPGLPEFLWMLRKQREEGHIKGIYIYTANTALDWVKFLVMCIMQYYGLPIDTFDGIKHSPGGLKVVPEDSVLYDDHPENVQGNCVPVDPYTNEIPWDILEPLVRMLPDDGKGGLDAYIAKDRAYADVPHEPESEGTLLELCSDFEPHDYVLLDLDETLISGARVSAYYFAINHFLRFKSNAENGSDTISNGDSA